MNRSVERSIGNDHQHIYMIEDDHVIMDRSIH